MAKSTKQGRRGERGIPGPMGPRGEQGPAGHTGRTGVSGPRGARGLIGKTGKGGFSSTDRQEILNFVQGQINEVQKELSAHIKRMDSLRGELDDLRANVARLGEISR
jgi:hypothetical protein